MPQKGFANGKVKTPFFLITFGQVQAVTELSMYSLVVLCPNDGLPGNNCYQAIVGIKRSEIIFPIKWSEILFDPLWGNFLIS